MKTLQELYTEIIGSDEMKKAFVEAAKGGKVADFLKANGCEATPEEIKAFLKEKTDQPLSDEELDSVAGGGCNNATIGEAFGSVLTFGTVCGLALTISLAGGSVGQKRDGDGRLCSI